MKKKQLAAAGGVLVLIAAGIIFGSGNREGVEAPAEPTAAMAPESAGPADEGVPESVLQTEPEPLVCEVSQAEQTIIDALWERLEAGDDEGAARVLNDNDEQLQILFYTTMNAADWRYDGTRLTDELDGTGLVFRRPTSIYYGELSGGLPGGTGMVLQASRIHAGRYDYAKGVWRQGMLEGEGSSGYRYYEEPEAEELMEVAKSGVFHENLMDGAVTYTSVNKEGAVSSWLFYAENGVTVLDESWIYEEERGEYQLFSQEDDTHAYILPQDDAETAIWKNQVSWE